METLQASHAPMEDSAVPIEQMTQPMGPLEEGDQTLVDAAHRIPAGVHEARHPDGTLTRVVKGEHPDRDVVTTTTYSPDGTGKEASATITHTPGLEGVRASSREWPTNEESKNGSNEVHRNDVQDGPSILDMKHDREQAQAVKLQIARHIDQAGQNVDTRIQDPEVAREMALGEKPHRDEIAERNQEVEIANEAVKEAARRYAEDGSHGDEIGEKAMRASRIERAARGANETSLAHANAAAEAIRQEHQV